MSIKRIVKPMSKLLLPLAVFAGPHMSVAAEDITYRVDNLRYEGYWSQTEKEDAPLIILIHDWDGLTDYEKKRADMLTKLGYDVFAVDMFGKGIRPTEVVDKKQHTAELYQDRNKMRKLIATAAAKAEYLGGSLKNKVVVGYCFGGAVALEAARAGLDANGFVSFHGGLATPEGQDYTKTKAPVMIFHGTADSIIPMTQFSDLAAELEKSGIEHEMITYGGAPHAFTVFDTKSYHRDADVSSWRRFNEFLEVATTDDDLFF